MNCINCQFELPAEAKFCLDCGAQQPLYCECGQKLPHSAKFCMECGCPVKEVHPPKEEPVVEVQAEPVVEVQPEPVVDVQAEPVVDVQAEPVVEVQPEPVVEVQPEPVAEVQPEPVAEVQPEPVAEVQPEPVAEVQPEPVVEVQAEPVAEEEAENSQVSTAFRLDFCGEGLRGASGLYLRSLFGKLYYYQRDKQGICQSLEDGTEEKVIITCPATPSGMVVNETGIYVHYLGLLDLGVQQYTLEGQYKSAMDVPLHAKMREVLVYGDTAYVSVTELVDVDRGKDFAHRRGEIANLEGEKRKDLIYYLNFSDQSQKAFNFYGEHGEFNLLCANQEEIVFRANFKAEIMGTEVKNSGLYRYNKEHNTIASLTHRACQPHWIASDKERYLKASENNKDAIHGLSIPFFDMENDLMWVQQTDETGKFLEGRTIESPGKSEVRRDCPRWYYTMEDTAFSRVYFDGFLMYRLTEDDSLLSILKDGTEAVLTAEEHCQKFVVFEDYVYIYSQNYDLHQHRAKSHGLPLVRNLALHFP